MKTSIESVHLKIEERYRELCVRYDAKPDDHLSTMMDLSAVANAMPDFRWDDFLAADDFNFCHDIFGIKNHLDRPNCSQKDGSLKAVFTGCFVPRFAH